MGIFGSDDASNSPFKTIGVGPSTQFPVTGQGGDSAIFNAANAAAMKDTTALDAATNPWNDPNSNWNKGINSPFDPKYDPNSNINRPFQHSMLSTPATYGQTATNMALKAPAQAGVSTPSKLVWTQGTDEHGQAYGHWVDAATAPQSGPGSPNFNTNGNDSTAAGTAARAAAAPSTTAPATLAPPPAQVIANDPYTPGTQAFTDRKSLMDDALTRSYNGAQHATMDQLAQMGMGGGGFAASMLNANNLRAAEAHGQMAADLSSNDPLRNLSYLKDAQGLTSAGQMIDRYGAETPLYLKQMALNNTGLDLTNAAKSQQYDVVSQKLPLELEQMRLGDVKAGQDIQAFAQELPMHLQEMQASGQLKAYEVQQAKFIADHQGALAAMAFIANVLGGATKMIGAATAIGA